MVKTEENRRGYAVGVQTFDRIRERSSVYIALPVAALCCLPGRWRRRERRRADQRHVWAVGLNISEDRHTIDNYKIVQVK